MGDNTAMSSRQAPSFQALPAGETTAPGQAVRPRRQRVQSIATGMHILKALADLGGRAGLTELARHIKTNPAKVHRYVASLVEEGLLAQDPLSSHYFLGPESIRIGLAAMHLANAARVAEPALVRLRDTLAMTCFVAVMGNLGPTIVRFEEPGLPVTLNVRVGSVLPLLWSATGRVCLAFRNDAGLREQANKELQAATPERRALLDAEDPVGEIQQTVRRGQLALVRDTNLQGISAIAAPIFDFSGHAQAVLTVLGTSGSFQCTVGGSVARALLAEAHAISHALGYVPEAE